MNQVSVPYDSNINDNDNDNMKFYLDTEFHEYKKKPLFGKPIDTIELISIGIVSEGHSCECCKNEGTHLSENGSSMLCDNTNLPVNGHEYYAICKDFDVDAAWNSYQWKEQKFFVGYNREDTTSEGLITKKVKEYWLRENVLKPIFDEFYIDVFGCNMPTFNLKSFTYLVNKIGKTREIIADEIKAFTLQPFVGLKIEDETIKEPEFYAYYADYDWVVFCWLFGRMIDLPKGFPMYCKDLKQLLDEKGNPDHSDVKQTNQHNALADAEWNKRLHNFITNL